MLFTNFCLIALVGFLYEEMWRNINNVNIYHRFYYSNHSKKFIQIENGNFELIDVCQLFIQNSNNQQSLIKVSISSNISGCFVLKMIESIYIVCNDMIQFIFSICCHRNFQLHQNGKFSSFPPRVGYLIF